MTAVLPRQLADDDLRADDVRLDDVALDNVVLDDVSVAIDALRRGLPVIAVDDAGRENEGDFIMSAAHATPEWLAWMVRHSSGMVCAPMTGALADRLQLPLMVRDNEDSLRTAYTVTVDASRGVTTGISAADRATTLRALANPAAVPGDLIRPGHVFPLRAVDGGVLARPGHTEAATDLCRLAGLPEVGVIAEVVEDDGTMMRLPNLRRLADSRGVPLISIEALIEHRRRHDRVERVAATTMPTSAGEFTAIGYRDRLTGDSHLALFSGRLGDQGVLDAEEPCHTGESGRASLVRVHSECLTGDAFGSRRCDCGPQLETALAQVAAQGGAVIYLRGHEGRGIGLLPKLCAYELQDAGLDTVAANLRQGLPADAREYGAAAAMLADLGLTEVRLLTNNPEKVRGLEQLGVRVAGTEPLLVGVGEDNAGYLRAKRDLMGHQLDDLEERL